MRRPPYKNPKYQNASAKAIIQSAWSPGGKHVWASSHQKCLGRAKQQWRETKQKDPKWLWLMKNDLDKHVFSEYFSRLFQHVLSDTQSSHPSPLHPSSVSSHAISPGTPCPIGPLSYVPLSFILMPILLFCSIYHNWNQIIHVIHICLVQ